MHVFTFSDALGTAWGLHCRLKLAEGLLSSTVLILPDLSHQPRPSHGLMAIQRRLDTRHNLSSSHVTFYCSRNNFLHALIAINPCEGWGW